MLPVLCPNCNAEMLQLNYDKIHLGENVKVVGCTVCNALFQVLEQGLSPIDSIFDVVSPGAVGASAAISQATHITLKSFLELYRATTNRTALDLGALESALFAHLAKIEGLLDSAVSGLSEMAMVPGQARDILAQVSEARELVSVRLPKARGVKG